MSESTSVRSVTRRCKLRPMQTLRQACEAQHARALSLSLTCLHTLEGMDRLEVLLLLWDEMDDWLGAARHLIRTL
jgi:hypothetical protein